MEEAEGDGQGASGRADRLRRRNRYGALDAHNGQLTIQQGQAIEASTNGKHTLEYINWG